MKMLIMNYWKCNQARYSLYLHLKYVHASVINSNPIHIGTIFMSLGMAHVYGGV